MHLGKAAKDDPKEASGSWPWTGPHPNIVVIWGNEPVVGRYLSIPFCKLCLLNKLNKCRGNKKQMWVTGTYPLKPSISPGYTWSGSSNCKKSRDLNPGPPVQDVGIPSCCLNCCVKCLTHFFFNKIHILGVQCDFSMHVYNEYHHVKYLSNLHLENIQNSLC